MQETQETQVLFPRLGRSPGEGNGNPLQYSCLENPMQGGAWQAAVHGVIESDMTEELSTHTCEVIHHNPIVNTIITPVLLGEEPRHKK